MIPSRWIRIPYLISYCHLPDCRSENGGIYGRRIATDCDNPPSLTRPMVWAQNLPKLVWPIKNLYRPPEAPRSPQKAFHPLPGMGTPKSYFSGFQAMAGFFWCQCSPRYCQRFS